MPPCLGNNLGLGARLLSVYHLISLENGSTIENKVIIEVDISLWGLAGGSGNGIQGGLPHV
jgi:hypothetical protein